MNIKNFDIRQFVFWPTVIAIAAVVLLVALGAAVSIISIIAIGALGILAVVLVGFLHGYVVGTTTIGIVILFFLFLIFYDEITEPVKHGRK